MKTVGATNAFIRFAFMIEGAILGLTGSLAGFFALWGAYRIFLEQADFGGLVSILPFAAVRLPVFLAVLSLGLLFGVGGSFISVKRFIDT